jgi:hypothetical protein
MSLHTNTRVGLLYLMPVIGVLIMWYVILFAGNPPGVTSKSTLASLLTEGPRPYFFRWLLALPALCLTIMAAYFSPIASTRAGYFALVVVGLFLAIAAWLSVSVDLAVCTTLPPVYALFVARAMRGANP